MDGIKQSLIDGKNYSLLYINMTLDKGMNCKLFNSCKKTKYASQVVAMSNAIGFTTFQGTESYRKAPIFINMFYSNQSGMNFDVDLCNTTSVNNTFRGYHVDSDCPCNSCDKSCFYDNKVSLPVLEGFSLVTVMMFYVIVVICTFIINICKCVYKKNNPNEISRSSSMNSRYNESQNLSGSLDTSKNVINNTKINK
jgi:hypothetical protein